MALSDIVLTHVIEHLVATGASEHIVFKGGSMLRRIHLGQRYRFSGDLDYPLDKASMLDIDVTISSFVEKLTGQSKRVVISCT